MVSLPHITERKNRASAPESGRNRMPARGVSLDEQGCSLPQRVRAVAEHGYGDGEVGPVERVAPGHPRPPGSRP